MSTEPRKESYPREPFPGQDRRQTVPVPVPGDAYVAAGNLATAAPLTFARSNRRHQEDLLRRFLLEMAGLGLAVYAVSRTGEIEAPAASESLTDAILATLDIDPPKYREEQKTVASELRAIHEAIHGTGRPVTAPFVGGGDASG